MKNFTEKLKDARTEKGLSQQQVAEAIGVTRSAYSNYEQGIREPDLNTLKKICMFFNISSDYLLGIEN